METDVLEPNEFTAMLRGFYDEHGRHDMAWRHSEPDGSYDPYKIMVSELMLQQTQVSRVEPKFAAFIALFPSVKVLADATAAEVLRAWNGLGYNRRAKYLHEASLKIMTDFDGKFPDSLEALQVLPGIGPNTAGAIMAYAYNKPVVFVETNIRTVLIHHYFAGQTAIPDKDIITWLQKAVRQLEVEQVTGFGPRQFYWALMDYGTFLKKTYGNNIAASKSYTKQSVFKGSRRQIRGKIIRLLTETDEAASENQLLQKLDDERTVSVIESLVKEGLVRRDADGLKLG